MSQISKPGTGGTPGSGIETINGDVGSITGSNVTIYANNAVNNCGASVSFDNSGTVSTLNLTDSANNTFIGRLSGNATTIGEFNTALGLSSYLSGTDGVLNVCVGYGALAALTSGDANTIIGGQAAFNLLTGERNTIIGANSGISHISNESDNILIGNEGITGESNTIRIGSDTGIPAAQNRCFIAGILGNTVTDPLQVVIDNATGQLGVAGGSTPRFQANLTAPQNLTGSSITDTIIFDGVVVNLGGAYNPATGVFTAPNTGFYAFTSCVFLNNLNSLAGNTTAVLGYTGSVQSLRLIQQGNGSYAGGAQLILNISWSMPMSAGETVQIQPFADGTGTYMATGMALSSGAFNVSSTFSGCQII